jgi:hypothetical protein
MEEARDTARAALPCEKSVRDSGRQVFGGGSWDPYVPALIGLQMVGKLAMCGNKVGKRPRSPRQCVRRLQHPA